MSRLFLRPWQSWVAALFGLSIAAAFAWELASTVPFVVDDSYITFSFSKNLASGAGPVYAHAERVEGYSNFLWMVLVALPLRVAPRADPMALARGMAVPFALLLFASTYALARARAGRAWSLAAVALVALNVNTILAFHSGLETLPYSALVATGFAFYTRGVARDTWAWRLVVPTFAAVALMRIDGFVPLAFIVGYEGAAAACDGRFSLRGIAAWAGPGLAVWAAWFAWRFWYYALPLPTTYYAKALIAEALPRRGPEYVFDELAASGMWLALPAIGYLFWCRARAALPIALFALLQLVYAARVGGDWMPSGRFVLPAEPLLVVLLVWAGAALTERARARGRVPGGAAAVVCAAPLAFVAARGEPHLSDTDLVRGKLALARDQVAHVAALRHAAAYLALALPPGARLVSDYSGVLAYDTQAAVIDMWGLCNRTIALRGHTRGINPIYGRTCPECYPALDPEYFHTTMPLARSPQSFSSHADVVRQVWQSGEIGGGIDFLHRFVSGRVVNRAAGDAVWFLERVPDGWKPDPRQVAANMFVEYPFTPGGLAEK
jgi:hypothetical protein